MGRKSGRQAPATRAFALAVGLALCRSPRAEAASQPEFWARMAAAVGGGGEVRSTPSGAPDEEDPAAWMQLAASQVKAGRYPDAVASYQSLVAAGVASADLYNDFAEVLMASGQLGEAAARYRDAIASASAEVTGERRPRAQDLALAYYGLGVALDRQGQPTAAREMTGRALALDPGGSLLQAATGAESEVFFIPDGDVYYYLGLAAEVEGRTTDAEAAFHEFLARRPDDRYARTAAGHLAGGTAGPAPPAAADRQARAPRRTGVRVVAIGTVEASGGIAAPLVDAAWRAQVRLLDPCFEAVAAKGTMRVVLDLLLDGRGRVSRARVEAPTLGGAFARCAEAAIKERLMVVAPARSKSTSVRTDLLVAFP